MQTVQVNMNQTDDTKDKDQVDAIPSHISKPEQTVVAATSTTTISTSQNEELKIGPHSPSHSQHSYREQYRKYLTDLFTNGSLKIWECKEFKCVATRRLAGYWYGYISLSPSHHLYNYPKEYISKTVKLSDFNGLNYAGLHAIMDNEIKSDKIMWWLGFQTDHWGQFNLQTCGGTNSKRQYLLPNEPDITCDKYLNFDFIQNYLNVLCHEMTRGKGLHPSNPARGSIPLTTLF